MEEKSVPSSTPSLTESVQLDSSTSKPRGEQPWRPRVDSAPVLHGFANQIPEADSILESPELLDPENDTAPLQGSKDRSDDDSLEDHRAGVAVG